MASKPSTRPTIKDRAFACCPNCGKQPERTSTRGPAPLYCKTPERDCQVEADRRALARGRALVRWGQAWRADRGSGEIAQGAFAQFVAILDQFNQEDREANRPHPGIWAATFLRDKTSFFDRQKR